MGNSAGARLRDRVPCVSVAWRPSIAPVRYPPATVPPTEPPTPAGPARPGAPRAGPPDGPGRRPSPGRADRGRARVPGPILGGQVAVPSRRERRRAKQRRRRPAERILRVGHRRWWCRPARGGGRRLRLLPLRVEQGLLQPRARPAWPRPTASPTTSCSSARTAGSGETAAEAQQFGNATQRRRPAERHHQDRPRRSGQRAPPRRSPSPGTPTSPCRACRPAASWPATTRSTPPSAAGPTP